MVFSIIKILLTTFTVVVLVAGTFQGTIAYSNYCDNDDEYDYLLHKLKKCDFSDNQYEYDYDVDFIAVIVLTGIGALFWVSNKI